MYYMNMHKSIRVIQKKRGRPATGHDPVVAIRLSPELIARVDGWAAAQQPPVSRSEAVRTLIEKALLKPRSAQRP